MSQSICLIFVFPIFVRSYLIALSAKKLLYLYLSQPAHTFSLPNFHTFSIFIFSS